MINKSNLRMLDLGHEGLHFELRHEGQLLGTVRGSLKQINDSESSLVLQVSCEASLEDRPMALTCLIKGALGRIPLRFTNPPAEVIVQDSNSDLALREALGKFQFKSLEDRLFRLKLRQEDILCLQQIKKQITELRTTSPLLGRGFLVPSGTLDANGLRVLMTEYNDLAWGSTSLAMNASMHEDERRMILRLSDHSFKVLEVGAGSGRLTSTLAVNNGQVVATDYIGQILETLKANLSAQRISNVLCVHDDILSSKLEEGAFDRILFLENGLGALSSVEQRQQALSEMSRLLAPQGQILLGIRSLGNEGGDHVMPASQDEFTFFGVYHVFTKTELPSLLPKNLTIRDVVDGDARPAGGNQFFVILERTS